MIFFSGDLKLLRCDNFVSCCIACQNILLQSEFSFICYGLFLASIVGVEANKNLEMLF
jgi:hypothetical protein